jgi:hypothetical protein
MRYLSVLKNRHTGKTGKADRLKYNYDSGRLLRADEGEMDIPF